MYNPTSGIIAAAPTATIDRICALLDCTSTSKVTPASLQGVLADTFSPSALLLRDYITRMEGDSTLTDGQLKSLSEAKALVHGFEGLYTPDSAYPVLLEALRVTLTNNLLRPLVSLSNVASGSNLHATRRIGGASARCVIYHQYQHDIQNVY